MPNQLELDLTRALAQAEALVSPPPDLPARVERRAKVRRRKRLSVGAGLLALLTPLALVLAPGTPIATQPPAIVASASLAFPRSLAGLRPIEQVWPDAVLRLPSGYRTVGLLDTDHILMTWGPGFEESTELYAYDVRQKSKQKLADLSPPEALPDYYVQDFATNRTQIFWWATANTNDESRITTYVWSAPRAGGSPRLVGTVPVAGELLDLTATDDTLYWSRGGGGVFQMALPSGPAQQVPGTDHLQLVSFPWASTVDTTTGLRNVLTGEEIRVRPPPGTQSLWCLPLFCVGQAGPQSTSFAMRPDGSSRIDLHLDFLPHDLFGGRYAVGHEGAKAAVIDVTTGQAGVLSGNGEQVSHDAVVWAGADGDRMFAPALA